MIRTAFTLCFAWLTAIRAIAATSSPVPELDDLAADWLTISDLNSYPSVMNPSGALQTESNVLGIINLKFPPFAQGGDTAVLSVNGTALNLQRSRWFPYQVERQADTAGLHIDTIVRMAYEQQGILFSVTVTNTQALAQNPTLSVALSGYIRNIPGTWVRTEPNPNTSGYTSALANNGSILTVNDTQSAAATAFAFATPPAALTANGTGGGVATWTPALAPGQSVTIQFLLAVAGDSSTAVALADGWARTFSDVYAQAHTLWEGRWESAFQPGNVNFSGSLPVLSTPNSKISRLYYMSALTVLLMERTNLPESPRVYVSGGPDQITTDVYYWDTSFWSDIWAQLDPAIMKSQCEQFLALDFHDYYALDFISGNPIGYRYGADDVSVFQMWWSYLTATGDWNALNDVVAGQTVLQRLSALALYWQSQAPSGANLADYGAASNIFSIDLNYVHQVASLNAGNVWMMRRMGDIYTRLGQTANATSMYSTATALAPKVLALYNGDGTWNCNQNGPTVNIRQVYDYIMLGRCMAGDLSGAIQTQMTSFVETELVTPCWIRAMSLSDPYLSTSNASLAERPDHGYTGAYDAWPATTTGVMMQFGEYDKALSLLESCESATHVGPMSQSHELYPASNHVGVRVPNYPAINPTSALTVEAWINASAWQANSYQGSIVSKDSRASGPPSGYVLRCGNGGQLSFVVTINSNWYEVLSGPVLSTNSWHHVAGTYDGSSLRVFLDGVQQAAVSCTGALSQNSSPLCVGCGTYYTNRTFIGAIDGVRVYGRSLSAGEISAQVALGGHYNSSDMSALALDLPFEGGLGTDVANLASGGVNGTLLVPTQWTTGASGSGLAILIPAPSTSPNNVYIGIGAQIYNESNGASFANAIMTGLFGFTPRVDGTFQLASPAAPRGVTGTLSGVRYNGSIYEISSGANGLSALALATAAGTSSNPVTGIMAHLSVLGATTENGGESNLTYNWSTTSSPNGVPAPTFAVNGTNAAKNTTVFFNGSGAYTFRVTITDAGGLSVASSVNVTVNMSPFNQWLVAKFGTSDTNPAIAGAMAIPAGDGIPNLLKYAFNLNPMTGCASGLPAASVEGGNMTLVYLQNDAAADLTYTVEQTTDLVNWATANAALATLSDINGTSTIKAMVPSNGATRMMLRLRVTMP